MRGCFGSLEAAHRSLRERYPLNHPEEILICPLKKSEAGFCIFEDNKYIIKINQDLDETSRVLMLVHEWAHALTWSARPMHGRKWALAYRRCYLVIGRDS